MPVYLLAQGRRLAPASRCVASLPSLTVVRGQAGDVVLWLGVKGSACSSVTAPLGLCMCAPDTFCWGFVG